MEKGQWEIARKAGVTIYTISPEEKIRWKKTVSDLDDKYVAEIAAKGHPAKEALEMMRRSIREEVNVSMSTRTRCLTGIVVRA